MVSYSYKCMHCGTQSILNLVKTMYDQGSMYVCIDFLLTSTTPGKRTSLYISLFQKEGWKAGEGLIFSVGGGGIGQPISVLNGKESHGLISINLDSGLELHFHRSVGIRISLPGDAVI